MFLKLGLLLTGALYAGETFRPVQVCPVVYIQTLTQTDPDAVRYEEVLRVHNELSQQGEGPSDRRRQRLGWLWKWAKSNDLQWQKRIQLKAGDWEGDGYVNGHVNASTLNIWIAQHHPSKAFFEAVMMNGRADALLPFVPDEPMARELLPRANKAYLNSYLIGKISDEKERYAQALRLIDDDGLGNMIARFQLSPEHLAEVARRYRIRQPQAFAKTRSNFEPSSGFATAWDQAKAGNSTLLDQMLRSGQVSDAELEQLMAWQPSNRQYYRFRDPALWVKYRSTMDQNHNVRDLVWSHGSSAEAYLHWFTYLAARSKLPYAPNPALLREALPREEDRLKLLIEHASTPRSWSLAGALDQYQIKDPALIKRLIASTPAGTFGGALDHPDVPLELKQRELLALVVSSPSDVAAFFDDPAVAAFRAEYLEALAQSSAGVGILAGRFLSSDQLLFEALTRGVGQIPVADRRKISKTLLRQELTPDQQRQITAALVKRVTTMEDFEYLASTFGLDQDPGIIRLHFGEQPIHYLEHFGLEWNENIVLKNALSSLAAQKPEILPRAVVDSLSERFASQQLIRHALRLRYQETDGDLAALQQRTSSEEIFGRALGIDLTPWAKMSDMRLTQIMELMLDIQSQTGSKAFAGWSLQGWDQPGRVELLLLARNLVSLTGGAARQWAAITQTHDLQNPQDLRTSAAGLREAIVGEVQRLFGSTAIKLSADQIIELNKRWGSLDVIASLLANLRSRSAHQVIEHTAHIINAILNNEFSRFKYEGKNDDTADQEVTRAQLAMLDDTQKAAWIKNTFSVQAVGGVTIDQIAQAKQDIKATYPITLKSHWQPVQGLPAVQQWTHIDQIVAEGKATPDELLQKIQTTILSDQTPTQVLAQVLSRTVSLIAAGEDLPLIVSYASVAKSMKQRMAKDLSIGNAEQLANDFASFYLKANVRQSKDAPQEVLAVTITTDDPHTLLAIGAMVEGATSCQNYKTGSVVNTLPGYVGDANVKAILSFHLKRDRDLSRGDYDRLFAASGEVRDVQWEGGKNIFRFTMADGSIITSRSLASAQLRHIMKLGRVAGGNEPGINLEPAYAQPGAPLAVLSAEAQKVRAQVAKAVGARVGQTIEIPITRNAPLAGGGVYSDAAGGQKTSAYTMSEKLAK